MGISQESVKHQLVWSELNSQKMCFALKAQGWRKHYVFRSPWGGIDGGLEAKLF